MALGARAQQYSNYIGLSLGSGLNTFVYTPAHGSQSLGLGYDAGLGYVHYFHLRNVRCYTTFYYNTLFHRKQ